MQTLEEQFRELDEQLERERQEITARYNNDGSNEMKAEIADAARKCGYFKVKYRKRNDWR